MRVSLLFLFACAGPPGVESDTADEGDWLTMTAEEPSIRGLITAADERSIRVEEEPADSSGSAKALVRFGADVPVRFADGSPGAISDLRVGATVSVWFSGPVAESYPVQASAGAVRIDAPAGDGVP